MKIGLIVSPRFDTKILIATTTQHLHKEQQHSSHRQIFDIQYDGLSKDHSSYCLRCNDLRHQRYANPSPSTSSLTIPRCRSSPHPHPRRMLRRPRRLPKTRPFRNRHSTHLWRRQLRAISRSTEMARAGCRHRNQIFTLTESFPSRPRSRCKSHAWTGTSSHCAQKVPGGS